MKRLAFPILGMAGLLALAGCGDSRGDRAVTGAGMGAAAGAVIGGVTPMSVAGGALIGAGAGGLIGGLTDKSQINLGDAPWSGRSSQSANAAPASRGFAPSGVNVRGIQSDLAALGYGPGAADGKAGPRTHDAVRRYQQDHGLLADGALTPQLAQHLAQQRQVAGR